MEIRQGEEKRGVGGNRNETRGVYTSASSRRKCLEQARLRELERQPHHRKRKGDQGEKGKRSMWFPTSSGRRHERGTGKIPGTQADFAFPQNGGILQEGQRDYRRVLICGHAPPPTKNE